MNKKNMLKIGLIILIILLVSLSGCIKPNINVQNHQFVYDTESVNFKLDQQNNIHIVWQERNNDEIVVYYTKLDNYGNDIVNDKKIYSMKIPRRIYKDPDLVIDSNNNIHIIFIINNNLFYTKLDNNGNTIREPEQLTKNNSSIDGDIIKDSSNNLHIVWADWRSGKAAKIVRGMKTVGFSEFHFTLDEAKKFIHADKHRSTVIRTFKE